jgi:hypothetical protein
MLEIIGLLLPAVTGILNKVIPDANARQAAQEQITQAMIAQQGAVQQAIADAAKAQAEVNLKEAESPSIFVAGWRPFVGWVCGLGFAYAFILQPFMNAIAVWAGFSTTPVLDTSSMMGLLGGLLGLGTMRTYEKAQGVDRQSMNPVLRK